MTNPTKFIFTASLLAGAWAFGCNGISSVGNGNNNETGTVRVELTDAPGDFAHVYIHVTSVLVHAKLDAADPDTDATRKPDDDEMPGGMTDHTGMDDGEMGPGSETEASGGETEAEDDATGPVDGKKITDDAKKSGWIVLAEPDADFDLLALQNDATALLGESELAPGEYKQLRLVLSSASVELTDGTTHALKVPSGDTSGLKIKTKFTVEAGQEHSLVLDFDAAQSIHVTGKGTYMLKPVIHVKKFEKTGPKGAGKAATDGTDDDKHGAMDGHGKTKE